MKIRKKDKQKKQKEAQGKVRCDGCHNAFNPDELEDGEHPLDTRKPAKLCSKCAYESMMDS